MYEASAEVTNTGDRAGAEVVQLYVGQSQCSVPRPVRELKQFARVELKPGETQAVKMVLTRDAFSYFSMASHSWTVDPGLGYRSERRVHSCRSRKRSP